MSGDAPRPRRRVLFVDDERAVLDGLRRLLRAHRDRWEPCFAESVEEALRVLEAGGVDTVVSDVNMPGRDGFDLLRTIRADPRWATLPVVILTGNGESGMKRRALELGASDLLAKPVDREDLTARIDSVLRLKAHEDELARHARELEAMVRDRTARLERSHAELIWRLGKAGEFRDSETGYHVVRVGLFAERLAEELGLDAELRRRVFLTAPLHDIGKIGIPDGILLKPGKLTEEEWGTMRRHTTIGARILREEVLARPSLARLGLGEAETGPEHGNPFTETAARIAESHHERWDGKGYPGGLAGEAIPLEARLTTVADVYDALSSRRPYKEPFPEDRVLAILGRGAGTQFDPEIHAAFLRCVEDFRTIRSEFDDSELASPQADVLSAIRDLRRAS